MLKALLPSGLKQELLTRGANWLAKRETGGELGRGNKPLRIAYGRIFHEANAFSPVTTTEDDFRRMHHFADAALADAASLEGEELKGYMPHAELSGFVHAAKLAQGVETVPLSSSLAVPGGPLTAECFAWLLSELLDRLKAAGPVDGVYLALHGSMEVQGLKESPEGLIIRRVRELIGPDAGIAVSFDLHANLAAELIEPVDVLVAYRTNPHWDLAPTGFRAGNRLIRFLRGQTRPVHAWRKLPMVMGGGTSIDFLAPMRGVFRYMRKLEDDPRVLSASLFMVHPFTSAENLGWAVHITTNGDSALAERLADDLAERAWEQRKVKLPPLLDVDQALDAVASRRARRAGPVTLVDVDDIVGAGAPGGNTHIVQALARADRGLKALVPVHDPALVGELWNAPLGSTHEVTLKGTPGYDQPEVRLNARVVARQNSDFGRQLRLDVPHRNAKSPEDCFHVVISERAPLPIKPRFWTELGISPRQSDLIVQKNFFHYRIFYTTVSFRHLPVVSSGATSLERVRTRRYAVPAYPGSEPDSWQQYDPTLRALGGARGHVELEPTAAHNAC
ncbi:MAG: M81 family metallopeptidase [Polyangiaceae bacterium]|nr:M81 family metallopeptidase [Myxococcales bacterium]MCB9590619.1 M81 family metallopeptidase [Polyangiaceae bacterium]MCB9608115.1 M81 family metallopeptidase [Polyangiaceae bacterium]